MTHSKHPRASQQVLPRKSNRPKAELPQEIRAEIVRLHAYYGSREIARRVGWSRKIVRRILNEEGGLKPPAKTRKPSKLHPFLLTIEDKVVQGLTVTRILREIREQGYSGARSILAQQVRTLKQKLALAPTKTVKRRFETRPGEDYGELHVMVRRGARPVGFPRSVRVARESYFP